MADHQIIQGSRDLSSDNLSLINKASVIILPQSCSEKLYRLCSESTALLFPSYKTRFDTAWRVDLQKEGRRWTRKLIDATGINLAAVDFVFPFNETDPSPMFLEINYYFGRRGLGGSLNYYRLLFNTIQEWLEEQGFDPQSIGLV